MNANSQRPNRRDATLSTLNATIEALNIAKEACGVAPAKVVFGSVSTLLTMIRDSMINKQDYVDLGMGCADICRALDRGVNGKKLGDLSQSVREAINQLTTTVAEIQGEVIKLSRRSAASRLFHARNDKDAIAAWKSDLNRTLHVFTAELAINTHIMVSDLHHNTLTGQGGTDGQHHSAQARLPPGELPPPPSACFGRDKLIKEIVALAESLTPIALVGTGGIGKTSIALRVLHHNHIKKQFGINRWFIRCDQFPASHTHFLSQLSKVIGAGVENPEDLTPLRPFLSSREMIIVLDNAESILDPQGSCVQKIYPLVEELSQFETICLCITSRISTVPRHCKRLVIPTLSMESACDIFYSIHNSYGKSNVVNNILRELDFHALSITLLATTASHNMWDCNRLAQEWNTHHVQVLQTTHNESLAATIELSLVSPTFHKLGPKARELLGVIAFFPQGIVECNLRWLFPTVPGRRKVFDTFCALSLTYRSGGFVTMLAPLRDHFYPQQPLSSPLLCKIKRRYFSRLLADACPDDPGFEEAQWIASEDLNVEHLLDVFITIDPNSDGIWGACAKFMENLCWHKPRLVVLGPKIEDLPDYHSSKPECVFQLSKLFLRVGNYSESKRLYINALELWRELGGDHDVACGLLSLADVNLHLGCIKEAINQAKEALEISERINDRMKQRNAWHVLAELLYEDNQLDAAEEAAFQELDLALEEDNQSLCCYPYTILGQIQYAKGDTEEAVDTFKKALGTALSSWHDEQFWIHFYLAKLFSEQHRFDDAHTHVKHAKSHTANVMFNLGTSMELQAIVWYHEHKFEEAKSEALCAADLFERLGATEKLEDCRELLQDIEEEVEKPIPICK